MNFLSNLIARHREAKKFELDKEQFFAELLRAVSDGKLTDQEIRLIDSKAEELGLTEEDLWPIQTKAYDLALAAAKADGKITAEEERELQRIQDALGIPDEVLDIQKFELVKYRLICDIKDGKLPRKEVSGLALQKSEIAHWEEPARLLEEKVTGKHYEGGSQGMSFRIAKGVSYRVGSSKGRLITDTAIVVVSEGSLVLTSQRVIFRGDNKSFAIKLDKLLNTKVFTNGFEFTDGTAKPKLVTLNDTFNLDIAATIIDQAIARFSVGG